MFFKDFISLLEAKVLRNKISMDEDDINYLRQFPKDFWRDALEQRYGNLLLQAVGENGFAKPGWRDVRDVEVGSGRNKTTFNVDTGITKLIARLKNLGYDTTDPDLETKTLSGMNLMQRHQASNHMNNWVKNSEHLGTEGPRSFTGYRQGQPISMQSDNPNLVAGYGRWTPNKNDSGENSYEPNSVEERDVWARLKDIVQKEAERKTDTFLRYMYNRPNDPKHLNYYYWNERRPEVVSELIDSVKKKSADPEILKNATREKHMHSRITSLFQRGHAPIRALRRIEKSGYKIGDLLKKGYSVGQLVNWINSTIPGGRYKTAVVPDLGEPGLGEPAMNPGGVFNQFSPLVRGVAVPNSSIDNYGQRKLNAKRANNPAYRAKIYQMQQKEPEDMSAFGAARRKAATNVANQISFKDWLLEAEVRSPKKGKPENYLDGMYRELGIDPNSIPEFIESGPIHLDDQGLWFNQAVWQVVKPIDPQAHFVKIRFHKSLSPNLNQRCYVRKEDGTMVPYDGDIESKTYLITLNKLASILGKGWQAAAQGGGPPGLPPV